MACVKSLVTFKTLTDEQIYAYIDDCKPFDKAGAYGIQDKRIVKKYSGSYSNIMGLPKENSAIFSFESELSMATIELSIDLGSKFITIIKRA